MIDPRSAIENTIYRYGYCYDFGPIDPIGDCFTEDAEATFAGTGTFRGRAAIGAELVRRRRSPTYQADMQLMHMFGNVFIRELNGKEAKVHTCWSFYVIDAEKKVRLSAMGDYDDVFANEGDQWLIRRRVHRALAHS